MSTATADRPMETTLPSWQLHDETTMEDITNFEDANPGYTRIVQNQGSAYEEILAILERREIDKVDMDFGLHEHAFQLRWLDGMNFAFREHMLRHMTGDDLRVAIGVGGRTRPIPDKPSTDMLERMGLPKVNPTLPDSRQALAVQVEDLLGYTPLRKDAGAQSRLQRLLSELEIDSFDKKTVDDYKRKMRDHYQAKADARMPTTYERRTSFSTVTRTEVSWRMVDLSSYTKPVPEYVLRKCVQIKQQAPDAVFLVDELTERTITLDPFLVVKIGDDKAFIEVWDEPEFEKTF